MDQINDDNIPSYKKSINTNMPTSMININTNQPPTTTRQPPKSTTQQYNLFPEQQQLYILQQELLKQETILSSFKNDSPERHNNTASKEELTTWQQTQVNEMNESINVIKRENEERKQKLFDNSAMGVSGGSNKEEVMLCGTANDSSASHNNTNNHNNMMSVQQQQQQQFIPEPLKLPSKRHPISRRGGKTSANSGGRLTQSLNNEQQQNYTTSYKQRPYSSSFTYGQAPFQNNQQQQQGYGYGGEDLATSSGMGGEMGGDTFGRPFHSIDQQQGPTNPMNKLFNGQIYMNEMEQYNINNESKMTRRNSIYKPNQSNNIMMSTLLTNTSYMEEVVPTINFGNISKPKKRRLNSNNNEMLLAMLTDTIVSPGRGSSGIRSPPPMPTAATNTQKALPTGGINRRRESTLSPPTNLDKVKIGDVNTPTMFANYFLSNIGIKECKEDEGGDVINTMPPPPLLVGNNNDVQMNEESKKKKVNQIKKKKLPAVVWQPSSNSSPKPTKSIKDNNHPTKPSSYNETPSSEIIKALSNQIKSNLSSSLASSSSSLYQQTNTNNDKGSSTASMSTAAQPQFALSMEASQASQQSIHDWDKKFGLRRAHSKTMRGKF